MINVRRRVFNSSGETTTHGLVVLILIYAWD
jgi:hypothetical protein